MVKKAILVLHLTVVDTVEPDPALADMEVEVAAV